jgi:hypothetical protein
MDTSDPSAAIGVGGSGVSRKLVIQADGTLAPAPEQVTIAAMFNSKFLDVTQGGGVKALPSGPLAAAFKRGEVAAAAAAAATTTSAAAVRAA